MKTHRRRILVALFCAVISSAAVAGLEVAPPSNEATGAELEVAPPPAGAAAPAEQLPPIALPEPDPSALRFTEEDFLRKTHLQVVYEYRFAEDFREEKSVIGNRHLYTAQPGDTFLDIARFYSLGYNEIEAANKDVDPWLPERSKSILLPTEWIVPRADSRGVVVNIPEMRMYYFRPNGGLYTYPVGLGRDEWRTPKGRFKVIGKTVNPEWVIPEAIRQERIREKGLHERSIAGGDPRNPLGKYRFELTMPGYRIHGTNRTYGVGMQVSHGCVRLYPEDIERLFGIVNVGSPGEFVYQPVKVGSRRGRIYVEVHKDIYTLIPGMYGEARRLLSERSWLPYVDDAKLQDALAEQSGLPVDITAGEFTLPPAPAGELPVASEQPPRNL